MNGLLRFTRNDEDCNDKEYNDEKPRHCEELCDEAIYFKSSRTVSA